MSKKNIKIEQARSQISVPQQQSINLDETDSETICDLKDQWYQTMHQMEQNIRLANQVTQKRRNERLAAKLQQEKGNDGKGNRDSGGTNQH